LSGMTRILSGMFQSKVQSPVPKVNGRQAPERGCLQP
jgi:hypothetical protein